MDRCIKVKIADKVFPFLVKTPEHEAVMRKAADEINASLLEFDRRYPDKPLLDKLVFVTMNQTASRISKLDECRKISEQVREMEQELGSYLEGK